MKSVDANDQSAQAQVRAFKLDSTGLQRALGDLEAEVMEAVWQRGRASVRDVQSALSRRLAFNTVMTVMNRLVAKGLLHRSGHRRAYIYTPTRSREQWLEELSRQVARGLVQDFGPYAVTQFVDALEDWDPAALEQLERLLAERKRRR
ncbi:MAG: BlaI/MecI/CopY family transcriptional regulator [Firmicutes bacterium]|nr:BlaI/MecI/CopY family transcriptional regulator [Bacillota bacterium]